MIISWVDREFLLHGILQLWSLHTQNFFLQTCHVDMIPLARVRKNSRRTNNGNSSTLKMRGTSPLTPASLQPLHWYRPSLFPLGSSVVFANTGDGDVLRRQCSIKKTLSSWPVFVRAGGRQNILLSLPSRARHLTFHANVMPVHP